MTPPKDLDALMRKLAQVIETATIVAHHKHEWETVGVKPHMPPELVSVRVDVLQAELWALAKAALDARLAAECVSARVMADARVNVVELRRAA